MIVGDNMVSDRGEGGDTSRNSMGDRWFLLWTALKEAFQHFVMKELCEGANSFQMNELPIHSHRFRRLPLLVAACFENFWGLIARFQRYCAPEKYLQSGWQNYVLTDYDYWYLDRNWTTFLKSQY